MTLVSTLKSLQVPLPPLCYDAQALSVPRLLSSLSHPGIPPPIAPRSLEIQGTHNLSWAPYTRSMCRISIT
jgi:hypothetical protein